MEPFFDGDLKDIWETDLDPTNSLKSSTEMDLHNWFLECEVKKPAVILNDKLISDVLFNGTLPIESEHSYSLNSDMELETNSPKRLHPKMDDMDDECFPAISLTIATLNLRQNHHNRLHHVHMATNEQKCPMRSSESTYPPAPTMPGIVRGATTNFVTSASNMFSFQNRDNSVFARSSDKCGATKSLAEPEKLSSQQPYQYDFEVSTSPDIKIEKTCIKDEQISHETNCSTNLSMSEIASFTKSNLVFEHKNVCPKLTPASQSLFKEQAVLLGTISTAQTTSISTTTNNHTSMLSKISAKPKVEAVKFAILATTAKYSPTKNTIARNSSNKSQAGVYGMPLTPPSSLPSDDSEGYLTPDYLLSPLLPNNTAVTSTTMSNGSSTLATTAVVNTAVKMASAISPSRTGRRSSGKSPSLSSLNGGSFQQHHRIFVHNSNNGSTRTPIHTPLISSQPKGSTGTLILTEEEKRTLLAEGYPIPQKLPLTKAEEKSLKKIRRKIKNKISAQESRRKKKEYMDQLERRVEVLAHENTDFRKRVESLEESNASLRSQLQKLKALLSKHNTKK